MSSMACLPLSFKQNYFEELRAAFDCIDSDRSGALSVDQICKVMEQLGLQAFRQDVQDFVAIFDQDGDGLLQFEEFVPVFLAHFSNNGEREESLRETFSLFDLDNDGKLSRSQIKRVLRQLQVEYSQDDIQQFIKEADTNGTGLIDFEDFKLILQ